MHGTVFVPEGKIGVFVDKFEAYAYKNTRKGKPKNKVLAESNHKNSIGRAGVLLDG